MRLPPACRVHWIWLLKAKPGLAPGAIPASALRRTAAARVVAVPRVRVGHVGAGAEHALRTAQQHHLDVVVGRELERLKRDVPIWKREVFEDGSEWVGLGP